MKEKNYFDEYELFLYSRLRKYGIRQLSGDSTVITNPVIQFVQVNIDLQTMQEGVEIIASRIEAVEIGIKNNALDTKILGGFYNNYITGVSSSSTYAIDNIRENSNLSVIGFDNATGNLLRTVDNRVLILCKTMILLADNSPIKLNDALLKWVSVGTVKIEDNLKVKRHVTVSDGSSDGHLYIGDVETGIYKGSKMLTSINGFNANKLAINEIVSSTITGVGDRCFPVYRSNGELTGYVPIYDAI